MTETSQITAVEATDREQWEALFRAYITFHKTSLSDEQYHQTFPRILDPTKELHALVVRGGDGNKLRGIAHFYPHQNPWSEAPTMHLNDLFVDPDSRGRGRGRALIRAVAEQAKHAGCDKLQWTTQHANPARKLYDQEGVCDFVEYHRDLL